MPESGTFGSVRGALSNARPYRDIRKFLESLGYHLLPFWNGEIQQISERVARLLIPQPPGGARGRVGHARRRCVPAIPHSALRRAQHPPKRVRKEHAIERDARYVLEMARARELDPMSRITNLLEASYLLSRGRRAEGLSRLDKALEIEPEFWPAYLMLANVHMSNGDVEKALDAARGAEQYSEGSAQATAKIGSLLAQSGRRDEALAVLERLLARSRERHVPPVVIAGVHCALGDRAQTLDALEQAYAVRDIHLPLLEITPCLGALQGEPRRCVAAPLGAPDKPATTGKL